MVAVSDSLSLLYFLCLRERCLREFVNPRCDCWPLCQARQLSQNRLQKWGSVQVSPAWAEQASANQRPGWRHGGQSEAGTCEDRSKEIMRQVYTTTRHLGQTFGL